jgi:hypothetical protein
MRFISQELSSVLFLQRLTLWNHKESESYFPHSQYSCQIVEVVHAFEPD